MEAGGSMWRADHHSATPARIVTVVVKSNLKKRSARYAVSRRKSKKTVLTVKKWNQ